MQGPGAILFDAGGTLIRLKESVGITYVRHALGFGLSVPFSFDLCKKVDNSFHRIFSKYQPLCFPLTDSFLLVEMEKEWWLRIVTETFQGIAEIRDFGGFFDSIYEFFSGSDSWVLENGSLEVLEKLQQWSIPVVVVSNFDSRLPALLEILGVSHLLSGIVFSSGVGMAKPDPRIFRLALQKISIRPNNCWHVGDSIKDDYEGAIKAGIKPLLYDFSDKYSSSRCRRIKNLSEILTCIKK